MQEQNINYQPFKENKMKLTIEVTCSDGADMEINLNRAIDDFSEALKALQNYSRNADRT